MDLALAVLVTFCVCVALFAALPALSSPGLTDYNPWYDVNNDGKINIIDISMLAKAFGTSGQNISKAGLLYDSGWVNITGMTGQNITITHNLNITDWNDPNIVVDIRGKTTPSGGLLRFQGLTPQQGVNKTYGGTGTDIAYSMVKTSDGGYALAGSTNSFGAGGNDFWLVKTDSLGNMLWNKTYGAAGDDVAYSVVQTSDGGYALAGTSNSWVPGDGYDMWLVKTDGSGNVRWSLTYGGTGLDVAYSVVQTKDGGYALAGYTNSFGAGGFDFWLVKTDSNGNMLWNKTYGGTGTDIAYSMVQTSDGGYALAGYTDSFGAGGADFWLVKTDASGNMLWNKTYGGTGADEAYSVVQTSDGGYALAGITNSFGAGGWDFWLVKTDMNGNMLWNKTYGGTGDDYASSMIQTSDGGYAIAGETISFGGSWLVKTDANGNMLWNKTYGGVAYSVVQTSDGGYALAGYAGYGAGGYDFWLVRTDSLGATSGTSGLAWVSSAANSIMLYRGTFDIYWNYVDVQIWQRVN